MKKRIALITGVTGQDGAYLAQLLLEKDYKVYGTYRRTSTPNFWRLRYLNILDEIELVPFDLLDQSSILEAINLIETMTNQKMIYSFKQKNRVGDHICYISDISKLRKHYPNWKIEYSLKEIIRQIINEMKN